MTTATKPRKRAGRPAKDGAAAKGKAEANGSVKMAAGTTDDDDPNQPPLPGMEDVNQRIPELTDECQRVLGAADKQKSAKTEKDTALGRVGELLKRHDREHYTVNGKKFYIEPGAPSVKMVNVKQNG